MNLYRWARKRTQELHSPNSRLRSLFFVCQIIICLIFAPISYAQESYTFVTKWSSLGTGDGQFQNPGGIAVDSNGNIYVADTHNNRIQKFNANGQFITKWGSRGTSDGQFIYPYAIAVDKNGNVYVTDRDNFRIQKFDTNGTFIVKWGTEGQDDGQFRYPVGIAVDAIGNVYITDKMNHRIQQFDANGQFLTKWGSPGIDDGQFSSPHGIAVDDNGNVYVTDYDNNRVQKFNTNGRFIAKWGEYGQGNSQFDRPIAITTDKNSNIYVTDYANYRVQKFTADGQFITKWGSQGSGDGQFSYPLFGISVDSSGNVYVADSSNQRIQKFAPANNNTFNGCNNVTEIPQSECESLIALYDSTNGDGWIYKTGWKKTNTPCKWDGIYCSGGHVAGIALIKNMLQGTLPTLNLPYLEYLDILENPLSGNIPSFSNMLKLVDISLESNQFSGNIPVLSNLPSLKNINFSSNKLTGNIPSFSNLPSLVSVDFSSNQLSGSIPSFSGLYSLTHAHFESNQLSGTVPNFSTANFEFVLVSNNCNLVAYDSAQDAFLAKFDMNWKVNNPACPASNITINVNPGQAGEIGVGISSGANTARLINLSANAKLPIIGGLGMSGTGTLRLMFRGFAIDSCVDPTIILQKYPSGEEVARNNDWQIGGSVADSIQNLPSHLTLTNPKDAGLLIDLPVGYYTISLGSNGCNGQGLVGVDLIESASSTTAKLVNLSANAPVPIIGGLGMSGSGNMKAMFRGFQVDPCVDANLLIQKYPSGESFDSNNDWGMDSNSAQVAALPSHLQLPKSSDAGLLRDLTPQYFTATLSSNTTCSGNGLFGLDIVE